MSAALLLPLAARANDDARASTGSSPGANTGASAVTNASTSKTPAPVTPPQPAKTDKPTTQPVAGDKPVAPAAKDDKSMTLPAKSGKPVPTATPQEVAVRIAEKLARLQAARSSHAAVEGGAAERGDAPKRLAKAATPARRASQAEAKELAAIAAANTAAGTVAMAAADVHWSYAGETGPARWAGMHPDWAACGRGQRQSPIDIRSGIKVELEPIAFDYRNSGFSVIDNGHTIQVNLGEGNHISVSGRRFDLVQFHFHRPSEEQIDGRSFAMVAHLVHRDAAGKLAVVAILIEPGAARVLMQTVWNNLPLEKNEAATATGTIDLNGLLPARRDYYTYMGSLTTPPCSEGVLWMVMKEPVTASREQLDIFARLYPMNARPIQPSAERMIKESN